MNDGARPCQTRWRALSLALLATAAALMVGCEREPAAQVRDKRSGPPAAPPTEKPRSAPAVPSLLAAPAKAPAKTGRGLSALRAAAAEGKHLFIYFHRGGERGQAMRKVFDGALQKFGDRARSLIVDLRDPSESAIVGRFGADRMPMPLALVVAPNGVVVGGFPLRFSEAQLAQAFAGPCLQQTLKALQTNRVVVICVRGASTRQNAEADAGVREFKATPAGTAAEIIRVDPADEREKSLLARMRVTPNVKTATTIVLSPPGRLAGRFVGKTDGARIAAGLAACASGCSSGG